MAQTRPKYVQVYEPKTKRWVKVVTQTGRIIGRKSTAGAFSDIPKRKTMPKRRKATGARMQPAAKPPQRRRKAATKKPAPGRKIRYAKPEKVASMVYDSKQDAVGGTAKKPPRKRASRKPDKKADPIPQNIKDLGRANVKTQLVRVKCDKLQKLPAVHTPDIAADILGGMAKNDREEVRVLYLNDGNKIIGVESAHVGSVNASICSPHEIYKTALLLNATSIMLSHNHPSGNPNPSIADVRNAERFKDAGKLVDVKLLDSLIIGDGKYYSLNQEGDL